ncbi:MAG: DegT/DnrJ/EryC1/StrS family aminotransferase [Candidatus Omnitrophota bacterium]|nr:DegT/DnrJ/EryC1/StrS family aminotransferase [Candidatus Omnitrophota bacterium]MDZ4242522.1 DegT/DnrJ/EryC1/StrS family aminotransferase [Candidatus Omnitrophota bacterium]
MDVQFIDFSEQYRVIKDEIDTGLKSVFEKGNFILGQEEKDFEAQFARYCESEYGVGVNSGTDALYLALAAMKIGPGDEVILPTFTFIATALCVSYTGAKPVFVDIEEKTYNLDPQKLAKAITPKTKVIIPVHIYGQPAEMDAVNAIAKAGKIQVLEDAAQAHGATYKGRKVGSLGDAACFSFYPTKSLGAFGDGGMIVTKDKTINENALMLRDYGRKGRYEHLIKGHNSRLDTVQAVVLSAKLKRLDEWNRMRNDNAAYYGGLLKDIQGVQAPVIQKDRTHVFQTFAIRVKNRDKVLEELKKKNIGVLIHYPIPLHLQEAYKELGHKNGDFPVAEAVCGEILSLPMFPHMSRAQIEYVCQCLKDVCGGRS